jgi:hypothetical protein
MSIGFFNLLMLFGLAGMAIPILIHLLNRRRYNVVDWGAMQFLQVSETTRRRLLIEEILLMALRMGLIALLVLALAIPRASGPAVAGLGGRSNRDVVLLFDGSASMGRTDGKSKTPHEAAKEWANKLLDSLAPGDSVVVLQAQQQVLPVLPEPTHDLRLVRDKIARLPRPYGGCDWPRALQEAHKILQARGTRAEREVIVLSDGQRRGWADSSSLFQWERLAAQLRDEADQQPGRPRVWVVNVAPEGKGEGPVPDYALRPLRPTRGVAWVGQRLRFKTAIALAGQKAYEPPYRIRLEADGKEVGDLEPPARAALKNGQVPFAFRHRFTTPGVHLVSVILEPDPPARQRDPKAALKDHLPGDNRQDLAVEVVESLPVLLVDGDDKLSPESSTYFLRKALAQSPDPLRPPVVLAHAVPVKDFDPALLTKDLHAKKPGSRPRVLVLADVPRLTEAQQQGVDRFLAEGGGVLVVLGERVAGSVRHYNEQLYRDGQGWLPARLDRPAGNLDQPDQAAAPDLKQFHHPSLELFRDEPNCTLDRARFPRWWKVSTAGRTAAVPVALLTTADPLLVEQAYKNGKVLLCSVPLDRSWDAGLPGVWEFPVLAHELVYYLADTRSAEYNVQPGQPLRYRPEPARDGPSARGKLPTTATVYPPEGEPRVLAVDRWPLVYEEARAAGVYRLQVGDQRPAYYVAQPDPQESDLTPSSEEDRAKVAAYVPVQYQNDVQAVTGILLGAGEAQDLWWLAMVGVILLLCGEVWLTRRMVKGRQVSG